MLEKWKTLIIIIGIKKIAISRCKIIFFLLIVSSFLANELSSLFLPETGLSG